MKDNNVENREENVGKQKNEKVNLSLYQAKMIANEYLSEISDNQSNGEASNLDAYRKLKELIEQLTQQDEIYGDSSDYHNFSVELAMKRQYFLACQLLKRGLEKYTNNVDLLADYLNYGVSAGLKKECKKYFDSLMEIPRIKWTWRSFSFSIYFLQNKISDDASTEEEINQLMKQIENIADDYITYFPKSEEGYRLKA